MKVCIAPHLHMHDRRRCVILVASSENKNRPLDPPMHAREGDSGPRGIDPASDDAAELRGADPVEPTGPHRPAGEGLDGRAAWGAGRPRGADDRGRSELCRRRGTPTFVPPRQAGRGRASVVVDFVRIYGSNLMSTDLI